MLKVNVYFIEDLLNPLIGLADIDEEQKKYIDFDANNEDLSKKIIISVLKPYYNEKSLKYKSLSKRSLAFYLNTYDHSFFEEIFNSNLLPFDPPDKGKEFFIWIWEVYFGGESYNIEDLSLYKEINDLYEPNRY